MGSVRQVSDVKVMLVKGGNGKGISKIEKTGTSGLVDTYTITYTDGSKTTYQVTNGNGIDHIAKTSTAGTTDTYTIYYTNGEEWTYTVENGGGQSGHTIEDDGVAMTDRSALDFIDHDLTDDSVNDATKVAPHRLSSAELSEICNPLPDAPTVVGNVRMTKLWDNPSPTSSFSAQSVDIADIDQYDMFLYISSINTSGDGYESMIATSDKPFSVLEVTSSGYSGAVSKRRITFTKSTNKMTVTSVEGDSANANQLLIPISVYGIKLL